jgi:hypothetical protein
MYDMQKREYAVNLYRSGYTASQVAFATGVSGSTVSKWARQSAAQSRHTRVVCPLADGQLGPGVPRYEYAYLLGLYLGDGCISPHWKRPALRIYCGDMWPGLIDRAAHAMAAVMPSKPVRRYQAPGCTIVSSAGQHWLCLLPQHGPGKKHNRSITFTDWQERVVEAHPWDLLAGLIHSDGCRFVNWTTKMINGAPKRYEYPRYAFTNKSTDIIGIFTRALDEVGVSWRATIRANGVTNVSIARRPSVALLDHHIGPKY